MNQIIQILTETLHLLMESSVYIIFGLLISGLIRAFLSPATIVEHLGKGRFRSVLKAALVGIPLPLCSCGVLPAAVSLKKQGANNGATAAFLISTPESGVDSISITYALLDPIMTIARPLAAFVSAITAGITENLFTGKNEETAKPADLSCPIDGCCQGIGCPPEVHKRHHRVVEKISFGMRYAFTEVWHDMAAWFAVGLLLAGAITVFMPEEVIGQYLGGGPVSMLIMLAVGIPIYICATASTPIAAALILKGISPGAALVFLLAGPATNVTSLTVLLGVLGKRASVIYLSTIAISAIFFGLAVDYVYGYLGISAAVVTGQATEILPERLKWFGTAVIVLLSIKPLSESLRSLVHSLFNKHKDPALAPNRANEKCTSASCGCSSGNVMNLP